MNIFQYNGSVVCGMCLMVTGNGTGSGSNPIVGTFKAFVNDLCPTCSYGSLDLGTGLDGKWLISWIAVDCEVKSNVQYMLQGSNDYYIKLQVRNTNVPVSSVNLVQDSIVTPLSRTSDNFFQSSFSNNIQLPIHIQVTSIFGQTFDDVVPSLNNSQIFEGNFQFNLTVNVGFSMKFNISYIIFGILFVFFNTSLDYLFDF